MASCSSTVAAALSPLRSSCLETRRSLLFPSSSSLSAHCKTCHVRPPSRSRTVRSSIIEVLPRDYGYVLLTAAASAALTQWQMVQVSIQRRKSGVPYPKMYEDSDDSLFNCYQRAHQNTLESYPQFVALLLASGVAYPVTSSLLGMVWVIGRIIYSLGYYTGEPKNRIRGSWGTLGLFGLIITCTVFGVKQIL